MCPPTGPRTRAARRSSRGTRPSFAGAPAPNPGRLFPPRRRPDHSCVWLARARPRRRPPMQHRRSKKHKRWAKDAGYAKFSSLRAAAATTLARVAFGRRRRSAPNLGWAQQLVTAQTWDNASAISERSESEPSRAKSSGSPHVAIACRKPRALQGFLEASVVLTEDKTEAPCSMQSRNDSNAVWRIGMRFNVRLLHRGPAPHQS